MKIFDNISGIVRDDMAATIAKGTSCIYAYEWFHRFDKEAPPL